MTKTKFYLQFFFVSAIFVLPPLFAPFVSGGENVFEFTGFTWWNAACLLVAALLNFFLGEFQGGIFRWRFFGERGKLLDGNFGNKNFGSEGSDTFFNASEASENFENKKLGGEKFSSEDASAFSAEKKDFLESAALRSRFFDSRGVFLDFLFRGIFFVFLPSGTGKFRRVIMLAEFFKTFGLLCVTQAFFEFLGFVLKVHHGTIIYFPGNINVAQIFSWAAALLSAAFYEETLYRAYLPFLLKKIFRKKCRSQNGFSNAENEIKAETNSAQGGKRMRFFDAAFEIAAIAIFGFSHLQNGILAVANALAAGFFLRRCAVRTGGIKAGFFAHFLYNALSLALLMTVGFVLR